MELTTITSELLNQRSYFIEISLGAIDSAVSCRPASTVPVMVTLRAQISKETDPYKLPALLEQLTEALDARANKFDIHPNAPPHRSETDAG